MSDTHARASSRARLTVALAAAVAAVAAVVPVRSMASPTDQTRLHFHEDDPGWLVNLPQHCDTAQPGLCSFAFDGSATLSGDITGFDHYHGWGHVDPSGSAVDFDVWEDMVSVTVKECGTGRFVW